MTGMTGMNNPLSQLSHFTHLDTDGAPQMVNVVAKPVTERFARAEAQVHFPSDVAQMLTHALTHALAQAPAAGVNAQHSTKGSIIGVATLAGIMAAKKTSELIPLCHSLGLDDCRITTHFAGTTLTITCTARSTGKTGVEMEALTGATVAALTVYDMCKALSHDIIIGAICLMEKRGGKRDFMRSPADNKASSKAEDEAL
jgi:cyclic pyranopterin monophosphate synthase